MKTTYRVNLINDQGCNFDNGEFKSLKAAKEFARKRGGDYTVIINGNYYQAKNNRISWISK
jgi:hypothetical protein